MDKSKQQLSLNLDYRIIAGILLAVIVVMLLAWKPWTGKATDRTVEVTGQTTVKAKPDEFVFMPVYEFKNADKQAALKELTAKSEELIGKLKDLGVADSKIKTNSDSWSYQYYGGSDSTPTYSLRLTVAAGSQTLAQKVQDYLVTTSPTGTISPQATFSEAKRKELESKGRDLASKDARSKAEQSAKNLGFRLSAVKAVNDGAGFGGIYPMAADSLNLKERSSASGYLAVQPGENELTYTVTVTYFIK